MTASISRAFRINDRFTANLRGDATNPLNHVTYNSWVTVINNTQFGLPSSVNGMRTLQTNFRLTF